MRAIRRIAASPPLLALGGIVAVGAALRFATIDLQSYRYDEAVTVARVLHPSLFDTFSAVPRSESTPPLYYLVAWFWSRLFGTGEVWMRSLSALAGTASILVVYLGARALPLARRAGLIAAAAVAVSPVLVWFSQDARAYSLVFLLTALSFLFFARARRSHSRRDLAWWAAFSALALATHYFAGFVVIAEAALLLWGSNRRAVAVALLPILAMGALLLPIALEQREHAHAGWIASQPRGERLERAAAKLVGSDNGDEHGTRATDPVPLAVPVALALVALALLLTLGDGEERRAAGVAAAVGGIALALPLLLALIGSDYVDGRNLLPVFVPLLLLSAPASGCGAPASPDWDWPLPSAFAASSSRSRSIACRDCSARTCATPPPKSGRWNAARSSSPTATRPAGRCATTSARTRPRSCRRCARSTSSAPAPPPNGTPTSCRRPSTRWKRSRSPTSSL